jgi:DNA-binding MarR family transcriptional regulator
VIELEQNNELLALSKNLTGSELKVWVALLWHKNGDGLAQVKQKDLSSDTTLDVRTIRRATKKLEEKGFIYRRPSTGRETAYVFRTEDTGVLLGQPCPIRTEMSPEVGTPVSYKDTDVLSHSPHISRVCIKENTEQEQEQENTEPPSVPPRGKAVKKDRSKFPILKTAEDICRALETVDLTKCKAVWEPHGVDVQDTWLTFQETCLSGTATRPFLNPYGYRDMPRAFENWCRKRKEQAPARASPSLKNKPNPRDLVAQVLKEREENEHQRGD